MQVRRELLAESAVPEPGANTDTNSLGISLGRLTSGSMVVPVITMRMLLGSKLV